MTKNNQLTPIQTNERIVSLDILRGFAVLGILIMNIQSFSMINAAYINPTAYGDLTGLNKLVWILSHLFADQKFLSIFSILFGAGIVLFSEKAIAKNRKSVGLHYRRMLYLLLFGMMHAYLLWFGDILVTYAISGLWVFLLRKKSIKTLFIVGIIIFSIASFFFLSSGLTISQWPEEAYKNVLNSWKPDSNIIEAEVTAFQGSWIDQLSHRIPYAIFFQTMLFFLMMGWRAGGLMLIGMALYKLGVLSGTKSRKYYTILMIIGILVGFSISGLGISQNLQNNWIMDYSMYIGSQFNYWGSLFTSLGYIGLIMLICKSQFAIKSFKATGQMAFTNYLLQTIICTTIFYGHGFGLFGKVERSGQIFIVFIIWIFLIIISNIWLKHFKFGPIEWLWRSLTYWKIQAFKKV